MTEIKAIECPKCGDTHKTILRPGDFRCASCGTEYFIDDGTVKFGQRPASVSAAKPPAISRGWQVAAFVGLPILIVGGIGLMAFFSRNDSGTAGASPTDSWYAGYGEALYVSADQRPVLMTLGTKIDFGSKAKADYAAFIDVASNSTIKMVPLPDDASLKNHSGAADFDVRQFLNGDIFVIVEKSQLFKVRQSDYGLTDITQSFFKDWPKLAVGVAKIEFTYKTDEQGFKLVANDGKTYFYHARTRELSSNDTVDRPTDATTPADTQERDAFSFSMRYDSDFPMLPGQLIAYRYRTYRTWPRDPSFDFHSRGLDYNHWDDPAVLAREGALTHRDFTPGRVYLDYSILYFDSDYVLVSYRPTPGKNALRYVQLLDAKTAAILFTTPLDVHSAPTECIRYKDGFAFVSRPTMFTLSMSGVLAKHTPFMFEKQ